VLAVHGTSSYELGLELAAGGSPTLPPARDGVVAASFLLRAWEDGVVLSAPDPMPLLDRFPAARVELLVREGQRLSDNDDDTLSHRLAVVALAGSSRQELVAQYAEVTGLLRFELGPVPQRSAERHGSRSL
jgi:hypothetical protein